MEFFNSAVGTLQTLVVALGAALCVWGGINLLEGYGQDNPGAKSQGVKHVTPNQVESKRSITKQNMLCISHTGVLNKWGNGYAQLHCCEFDIPKARLNQENGHDKDLSNQTYNKSFYMID